MKRLGVSRALRREPHDDKEFADKKARDDDDQES
jgi:hypothetical protein